MYGALGAVTWQGKGVCDIPLTSVMIWKPDNLRLPQQFVLFCEIHVCVVSRIRICLQLALKGTPSLRYYYFLATSSVTI